MKKDREPTLEYNVHYRQKNGGWQIIVSYKNEDGNWKQKSKQGFKTENEAKTGLFPLLKEIEEALKYKLNPSNITFKDFSEIILKRMEKTKTYSTVSCYGTAVKTFEALNEKKISSITTVDIQNVIDDIMHLKEHTLRSYLARLHYIFEKAIKPYKIRVDNPVVDIEYRKKKKDPKKVKALTKKEFESLFNVFTKPEHQLFILIAGTCGLRCGEVLGLTWQDIDFKNDTIDINKQWKRYSGRKYYLGELKTATSYRVVPLPPRTKHALQQYRNIWRFSADGRILAYSSTAYINTIFREKTANGPLKVTPHELRHTYATSLIKAGLDFKSVAKLLGHDVEMTMNTYSHVTADMDERSAKVVNKVFQMQENA